MFSVLDLLLHGHISQGGPKSVTWVKMIIFGKKLYVIHLSNVFQNKAYRPNAHLLYFVMHYNGSII